MKKLWLLAAALLAFSIPSRAQVPVTGNLTAQDGGNCTTANACLVLNVARDMASSVIQLSGTWSATVQFEASNGPGPAAPFTPIAGVPIGGTTAVTSATATGAWRFNVSSVNLIRVRVSSYSSGTVGASLTASNANSTIPGGGGTGGSGVTSITGDGTVECGVGATGAVTLAQCTAAANTVLAGPTSGGAANPTFQTNPNISIQGQAGTAAALASPPSQCSGGTPVATGIQANGNANCTAGTAVGVSSFSGDGTILNNSGSTGPVTATLANAAQNSVLAGPPTGGAGAPTYQLNPTININGNATTASDLASPPTTCTGNQVSIGISINGNAICVSFGGGAVVYTSSQTLVNANSNQLVVMHCASACNVTLPATPPSGVWNVAIQWGVGYAQPTIVPNGPTLNGSSASFPIPLAGSTFFLTTDAFNYFGQNPTVYIQQANLFSGSDIGVQINACLTLAHTIVASANTQSGVCDARGITGILTATHHISIPAGTSLLWGQAQLTISDSGTNDAVELAGDGGTLIGMNQSGNGTVARPQTSGYIACGINGCTTLKNPTSASASVVWPSIEKMELISQGSGSKVVDLSGISHAHLEDNRLILGTGGSSYGIYGDSGAGNLDATNTLIRHNEYDPQSANDICQRLAGIFNVVEIEANTCILPASNTGTQCFVLDKDSNNNYPNNDEFYGNDCEGASTSFGQIGYNIIAADSVTIGPNNRCENTYNCFQFPINGSATGIHVLDPYISVSANTVLKPNEPSAAQLAIDNNGPNWLPSMHFGFNDNGGDNLLGNANFEGWTNSTTLNYWGGVTGTSINQAGSGIYAQQASASSPTDATTQGTYNVAIGDNATLGLGINSACIRVDSTLNYTLAFRILSSSTSIKFRPGFRFYYDPNCTEADKITNVATNARVLAPQNYAGTSNSAISGNGGGNLGNWQSTNASLTYNNGITCNCNVTGADWTVAQASTWTPTPNYAITFRVPNAYSLSTTIAQSMRVFILENTAANPNVIYVDDVVLSQGAASANLRPAPLPDTNPAMYGAPTVNGNQISTALSIPTGTATFSVGSGITSVVCATGFSCNNTRGTLTIVGGTATTGTIATVTFSAALGAAPACFASMNGGGTLFSIGNSAPTTTAFNITAGISVIGATFNVNYLCQP